MVWKGVGCCRVKRWPSVVTWEGWRHWRGEGCAARVVTGQWSTTPCNPSPRHPSRHPARVHHQCWIIHCELPAFVLFLELFVLIRNRPIIGRLFGTDYRPTDIGASLTSTSSQLLNITTQHITSAAPWPCFTVKMWFCFVWIHIQWKMEKSHSSHFICDIQYSTTETRPRCNIYQ